MCHHRRCFLSTGIAAAASTLLPQFASAAEPLRETELKSRTPFRTFGSGGSSKYERIVSYAVYGPRLPRESFRALQSAMNTIGQQFVNPHHAALALGGLETWGVVGHRKIPHFRKSKNAFIDWISLQWKAMEKTSGFPFVNIYLSDGLANDGFAMSANIGRVVYYHQGIGIAVGQQGGYAVSGNGVRGPGFVQVHLNRAEVSRLPDPQVWCGVIAHEILHNMGHTHPNGQKGSFIEEFQKSIQMLAEPPRKLSLTGRPRATTCGV